MSSMPLGARMKPENHDSATIGKAVKVIGQIYTKEDLFVDGDLEGTVEALEHKLTIGPNGKVHADVKAREVAVLGSLQGDVEATDKIEIRKDAKLVGNIKTARILIEDGAYFKGGIEVVKREDEIEAKRLADGAAAAAKRFKDQTAAPGSEAALRKLIEGLRAGNPDYDLMSSNFAAITRQQLPQLQSTITDLGAIQSVSFKGVGPGGADIYQVKFEKGALECRISLGPDGKVEGAGIRPQ